MVHLTKVTDALTLCLNDHSIRAANHGKAIVVANGGALTLTDCIGAGKLIHTSGYAGTGVCILTDGTFTMYSGIITGNNSLDNSGGVYSGSNATTCIYGGSITYNEARQGSGVFAEPDNGVHLKGNVIIKNNGPVGTNDLLANTTHYLDGSLDSSSEIGLSVPSSTADGMKLLQPEANYTIASDDLDRFFFNNKSAGYVSKKARQKVLTHRQQNL